MAGQDHHLCQSMSAHGSQRQSPNGSQLGSPALSSERRYRGHLGPRNPSSRTRPLSTRGIPPRAVLGVRRRVRFHPSVIRLGCQPEGHAAMPTCSRHVRRGPLLVAMRDPVAALRVEIASVRPRGIERRPEASDLVGQARRMQMSRIKNMSRGGWIVVGFCSSFPPWPWRQR